MAKKKTGLTHTLFQEIDPYGLEAEAGQVPLLSLDVIRPDPAQPRRLLPPALAQQVASGELAPAAALRRWQESGEGTAALAELRRLADSISRHGLINPITVRQPRAEEQRAGAAYFVVTGERRYWAHVLLHLEGRTIHVGNTLQEPAEIRAQVVGEGISVRAHQLIENIMREDINAAEKARGLWALRYELSGIDEGVNYSSPAAAARPDLVPWTAVSEELGISKRYRIFLTSVLNLSPAAQEIVDEHNLAEITIRPIVQKLRDEPELQLAALRQLVAWQEENEAEDGPGRAITRAVKELVDQLLADRGQAQGAGEAVSEAATAVDQEEQTRRFRRRVRSLLRFLQRLPENERWLLARDLALDAHYAPVADDLEELTRLAEDLLHQVDHYGEE